MKHSSVSIPILIPENPYTPRSVLLLCLALLSALVLVVNPCTTAAAPANPIPKLPLLRIPELTTPPVITGRISPDHVTGQWVHAARLTGLQNFGMGTLPPSKLQPTWWLAYDKTHLYLASYFPAYPKGTIVAQVKHGDEGGLNPHAGDILGDDHVEIQICDLPKRSEAVTKYFYKIMTNPYAAVVDQRIEWSVGWMGYEWQSGAIVKCHTTRNGWSMEMAVPLKSMNHLVAPPNNTQWFIQLADANGESPYYAWQPVLFTDWDHMGSIVFDSHAPVFQLLSLGHVQHGQMDVQAAINVPHGQPPVQMRVRVLGAGGKILFVRTRSVPANGKPTALRFHKNGLPVGGHGQTMDILAWQGHKIIYRDSMPFDTITAADLKNMYTAIAANRHNLGQPNLSSCYYQSYHTLTARCDVNILEINPTIRTAKILRASIVRVGHKKPLVSADGVIQPDGLGRIQVSTGKLPLGKYQVITQIIGNRGQVLASRIDPFAVKHFPWEHNKLGEEHIVAAPFTPVKVLGSTLHVWDRAYHFAATALPSSIISLGRNMLAAPITLTGTIDGKKIPLVSIGRPAWTHVSGYSATVTGHGQIGPHVHVTIKAKTEYDGTTFYTLTLTPHGLAKINELSMVIPLHKLMNWEAMRSSGRDMPYGTIGEGTPDGVFWKSSELPAAAFIHDTFLPYCVISDGQRALSWAADSDQGWMVSNHRASFLLEKHANRQIWMHVRFVDTPSVLKTAHTIHFMLTAMPMKPKPADWRYRMWGMPNAAFGYMSGWQGSNMWAYGCGPTISFRNQNQFEILRHLLSADRQRVRLAAESVPGPKYPPMSMWYVSANTWGYAMPEYPTYSGEWTGMTHPPINPQRSYINFKSPFGVWSTAREQTRGGMDLIQSAIDCRVYDFDQEQKKAGMNGYWWDNGTFWTSGNLIKGTAYIRNGHIQGIYNITLMRQMLKRMAVVSQLNHITPFQSMYAHGEIGPLAGFVNWLWAIEGPWYLNSDKVDLVQNIQGGLNGIRTILQTYQGLPISMDNNTQDQSSNDNANPWQTRSCLGVALLFDVGDGWNGGINGFCQHKLVQALNRFDYFNHRVKWVPYWRTAKLVNVHGGHIVTTLYIRKLRGQTPGIMLVLFNDGHHTATVSVQANTNKLLGLARKYTTLHDLENWSANPVPMLAGRWGGITIPRHDFRLMLLGPRADGN